jgi:hypothetical protein
MISSPSAMMPSMASQVFQARACRDLENLLQTFEGPIGLIAVLFESGFQVG